MDMNGHFFEDFKLGQVFASDWRAITHGDQALYISFTGDRTPRFCDARDWIHPLLLFHMVFGQTVRDVSLNARANLGYANMIWHNSLRAGSAVRTRTEVIGLKENRSGQDGIVWVRSIGESESGPVLSFVRWVMVKKREEARTEWFESPVKPELPEAVASSSLIPVATLRDRGPRLGDYEVGQRIAHPDGFTLTEAEHRMFTRHFQNSARIHFDERISKPSLVYGGYPWSIGYASAYAGMEGRLGTLAVNSGTHARPTHAGDTLTTATEILDITDLGDCGALRCRMSVSNAREVVLVLDYWEAITR